MVIQMRAHGGNAGMGPTNVLDATESGAVIFKDADKSLYVCDGTTWQKIGAGGGGADSTPDPFDFPASPAIAGTTGHTWSPLEITGFDGATVSIVTTAGSGKGEFRICSDSACSNVLRDWTMWPTGIAAGNYLQIRIGAHTNTRTSDAKITVMVGGMSDDAPITSTVPGSYFLAFVTNGQWTGNLGGVFDADFKCQSAAMAAGLAGTFRAWISSSGPSVPLNRFQNVGTTSAFYMPNGSGGGIKLVDNWADLVDGTIGTSFNRSETGATRTGIVWTGTNADGNGPPGNTCANWTSASAGLNTATVGNIAFTDSKWSNNHAPTCDGLNRLYCFQTVLPN